MDERIEKKIHEQVGEITQARVLSDYPAEEVIPVEFSEKNEIVFKAGEKSFTAEIPISMVDHPVVTAIRKYFHGLEYRSKALKSQSHRIKVRGLSILFDLAREKGEITETFGVDFLNRLKNVNRKAEEMLRQNYSALIQPVSAVAKSSDFDYYTKEEINACWNLSKSFVQLANIQGKKKPSAEILYDTGNSASETRKAFEVVASALLLEWSWIRHEFRRNFPAEHQRLIEIANKYDSTVLWSKDNSARAILLGNIHKHYYKETLEEVRFFLEVPYRLAEKTNHPLLWDFLFGAQYLGRRIPSDEALPLFVDSKQLQFVENVSDNEIREIMLRWLHPKDTNEVTGFELKIGRRRSSQMLPTMKFTRSLPAMNLIAPSEEEQQLVAWVLATDRGQRQQKGNILGAKCGDLKKLRNTELAGYKPDFYKSRRKSNVGAPIHAKTSKLAFNALAAYMEAAEKAQSYGVWSRNTTFEESYLVPTLATQYRKHDNGEFLDDGYGFSYLPIASSRLQCYKIAIPAIPGSISGKYLKDKYSPAYEKIDVCFQVIHKIYSGNVNRRIKLGLSINTLAETNIRAVENDRKRKAITPSNDMSINTEGLDIADIERRSETSGHTPAVHHEIYVDRSNDKIKLNRDSAFARMVGDEMIRMSELLANEKMEKSRPLTIQEARHTLGIKNKVSKTALTTEQIFYQAEAIDFLVDTTGLISDHNEIYILKTPLVAYLISSYINAIDKDIPEILDSNSNHAIKVFSHRMFLQGILGEFFDAAMIRKGKEEYGNLDFPRPRYQELKI